MQSSLIKKPILFSSLLMMLLVFTTALFLPLFTPVRFAKAVNAAPHIVIKGDVWMEDANNGNKLFKLPESYYGYINSLDDYYYYITFNGVSGRVSKNLVTTTGYHLTAPGTSFDMQINKKYWDFDGIKLTAEPKSGADVVATANMNDVFTFIGEYPAPDTMWYYVRYNNSYGYIMQERTTHDELTIPSFNPEPEPLPGSDNKDPSSGESILKGISGKELKIIIIIGLAFPAIIILFLIFRPQKSRKYYDD